MISILLAVYNGELYLKKSIESILNQTYVDFELLIGFNGTVDDSKNIVSLFKDDRIKVFDYGMDSGKSVTLNKLINEANGEWLAMQDDDDIWLPNKLELQVKFASTGNYDVIGTKIYYCDDNESIIGSPFIALEHKQICLLSRNGFNQVPNTSVIFRKSLAIDSKGWDNSIVGVEDFDFWLKLINLGGRFINIDSQLVLHRLHLKSNFNTQKYDVKGIIKKYKNKTVFREKIYILFFLICSRLNAIFWKLKMKLK